MATIRRDILIAVGASAALSALSLLVRAAGDAPAAVGIGTGIFGLGQPHGGDPVWVTNADCRAAFDPG